MVPLKKAVKISLWFKSNLSSAPGENVNVKHFGDAEEIGNYEYELRNSFLIIKKEKGHEIFIYPYHIINQIKITTKEGHEAQKFNIFATEETQ
ncbi:MAG: hypothetical protein BAJALOKI2v1_830014 [Promethearchaeota archaeon]|nr:MAG: hypothetical protein BAJALOKI2v1_830014 [Candidatus Lokiarchaeota archaeon]